MWFHTKPDYLLEGLDLIPHLMINRVTCNNFSHQHQQGLDVGLYGFMINKAYPFLGATPDGTAYYPSNHEQPFAFIGVKFPYSHEEST